MVKRFRSLVASLLVALSVLILSATFTVQPRAWPQTGPSVQARRDAHVIMISVDGMVPDYYTEPGRLGLRVPNLVSMKLGGAYAEGVEGVYPSVTYPSHTTMVTGVLPAKHGIVQNRIFEPPTDPQTGAWYWYASALKCETLWTAARRAGLTTAAVGWPVTVGADIDYNVPEIWDPSEKPITGKRMVQYSTPGLVQKALEGGKQVKGDEFRTVLSEFIIRSYRPSLMLIHLVELDDSQHKNGPRTPPALETMEREDGYIGRIVEATRSAEIYDRTTFFIVSDHGFASIEKKFEPNVVLVKKKLISLDSKGKVASWKAAAWPAGGSCPIVLRDPTDKSTAAEVLKIFSAIAARNDSPLNRVVRSDELNRLGAVPEAALVLEAAPGYSFDDLLTGPSVHDTAKEYRGTHGYLPTRAEMRSSLLIFGEGSRVGAKMPLAEMIDIGPTAAAVLGVSLHDSEGTAIRGLIRPDLVPGPRPENRKKSRKDRGSQKPRNSRVNHGTPPFGSARVHQ